MKKILFVLLIALCGCFVKAQDTTLLERVNYLYEDLYNEYFYGSLKLAQTKWNTFSRASGLYTIMVSAVGEGNTTLAGESLSDLNAMFGTSYSLPTFDYDETSQPYLKIDSIKVGDMTGYADSLITWPGVLAAIAANPSVDESSVADQIYDSIVVERAVWRSDIGDSITAVKATLRSDIGDSITAAETAWRSDIGDSITAAETVWCSDIGDSITDAETAWRSDIGDSITAVEAQLRSDISDSLANVGSDSTHYSKTIDYLWLGTYADPDRNPVLLTSDDGYLIIRDSLTNGDDSIFINPGSGSIVAGSNHLALRFYVVPNSTTPNILPQITDGNTGFTWVTSDKLGLVAGGVSTFTSEYSGSLALNDLKDSARVTGLNVTRIHTANGTHTNLVSFSSAPAVNSVPIVASDGTTTLTPSSTFGGGIATTGSPAANQAAYFSAATTITGATNMYIDDDSISIGDTLACQDSVYLVYLIGAIDEDMSLGLSSTGAIIADSLPDAGIAFKVPLMEAQEMLNDTLRGEIAWYDHNGKKYYTIGNSLKSAVPRLQFATEMLLRQNAKQDEEIEALKKDVAYLKKYCELLLKLQLEK